MDLKDFGFLQLRVLEMIWERGEATAGDLWESWPHAPQPAYTTVLSVLQKLYRKRLVRRRKQGRAHAYTSCIDRESFRKSYVSEVRRKIFGGRALGLVAALVDDEEIADEEFDAIQRLLARKRRKP